LHQRTLREGRVAKRVGLAQVEPAVLNHDLIGRKGISPISQDEILRRVRTDHACTELESLRAEVVHETECWQEDTCLKLDVVLAISEREHNLVLGFYQENIRARATYESIATRPTGELVIAITTLEHVVPVVAPQGIVPSVA
jgi:hypothetical protein